MSLIRRVPWTVQPQYPVGINWSNPITHKLRFAWGGPACQRDSVQNRLPTTQMPLNESKFGRGIQLNTTGLAIPHSNPKSGAKSVVIVGNPLNYNGATNTYLRNGPSGGWGLSANNFWLLWTHYGVSDYSLGVAASGNVGVVGVTAIPSSTVTAYENGIQIASVAIGALNVSTATSCQMSFTSSGSSAVSTLAFAAYWDRELSAAEHASMAANQWQIFAPLPRRIWAPSAAAGGGGFQAAWARNRSYVIGAGAR